MANTHSEQEIMDIFNKEFEVNVRHETYEYAVIDGFDHQNKVAVEVKDRTIPKYKYPETIMGLNKYNLWKKKYPDYQFFFIVRFSDGGIWVHEVDFNRKYITYENGKDYKFSSDPKEKEKVHLAMPIKDLECLLEPTKPTLERGVCCIDLYHPSGC
jgi:hypothetical protein